MNIIILNFTLNHSSTSSLKALADIQLLESGESLISIYGVKLIQLHNKTFVVKMPSWKKGTRYQDICSIDKVSLKESITNQLIQRYEALTK